MLSRVCPRPFRCVLVGLVLVCFGSVLASRWADIYAKIVVQLLELRPGSPNYDMWKNPPVPINMDFYFFNWTNPEELLKEGSKPHFVEVGPYSFIETRNKKDVLWNANYTVSFKQERSWYFDEVNSVGPMSDEVTTLNAVAVSAAYVARDWNYFLLMPLNQMLKHQSISITRSVSELLFDGYSDSLILMGQMGAAVHMVDAAVFDKFAWFYKRNGSKDFEGVYNMATGQDDILKVAELKHWNYKNKTSYYPGDCGDVHGSMGERFAPWRTKTEPLMVYSREICRTMAFDYSEETVVEGISGYHYIADPKLMDNGTLDPANECYCGGDCVPSGTLNISSCAYGSPGFMSFPHFYLADPYYLDQVEGLKPDPDKHESYATIEPRTGLPLDVRGRMQFNLHMQPYEKLSALRHLPNLFFPMLWLEERASITPNLAIYVKLLLILSPLGLVLCLIIAACGIVMVVIALTQYYASRRTLHNTLIKQECSDSMKLTLRSRNISIYSPTTEDLSQNPDSCLKLQAT